MTELEIIKILLRWKTVSPFAIYNKNVALVIRNLSWGFFEYGEADIIKVDTKMRMSECEVKTSIADFRKDFFKNSEIEKERLNVLFEKYYAMPIAVYEKHKDEIEQKMIEKGYGIITIGEKVFNRVEIKLYPKKLSDNTITQDHFMKLARLVCFRQI